MNFGKPFLSEERRQFQIPPEGTRDARRPTRRCDDPRFSIDGAARGVYAPIPAPAMKRFLLLSLLAAPLACFLGACGTLSTDPAPGGISASETGMNAATIREWQDRTIRNLAY